MSTGLLNPNLTYSGEYTCKKSHLYNFVKNLKKLLNFFEYPLRTSDLYDFFTSFLIHTIRMCFVYICDQIK